MIKLRTSLRRRSFLWRLALPLPRARRLPRTRRVTFNSPGHKVKHVVHITFDNVHLRRDNPNVPSDLEQMPNLLNFLQDNGVVSGNHHTPLISHTAHDIVTALTGVYGDRIGHSGRQQLRFLQPDGSVGFQSSFLYWTAMPATASRRCSTRPARSRRLPGCPSPAPAAMSAASRSPISNSRAFRRR